MKKLNVCVIGATGLVGSKILESLEKRKFPIKKLKLLASSRSKGKRIKFKNSYYTVKETKLNEFNGIDLAFFASTSDAASFFAPEAVKLGAVVIDNGSSFRLKKDVPLIVPEVNKEALKKHKAIIANPNCSTIQLVVALKPILDNFGIKKVIVSTYQSVSGWGKEASEELKNQVKSFVKGKKIKFKKEIFPYQIAFNCLPHIDKFTQGYYTKEEFKIIQETKKILSNNKIKITATCVRMPVFVGHSEAVYVETKEKAKRCDVIKVLKKAKGVVVLDNPEKLVYPLPLDVAGKEDVYVGRIREDNEKDKGIWMWVVADNLLKGAATNAVQIGETLIKEILI
jgi:aspartate-semialdehyde dehydrogenase